MRRRVRKAERHGVATVEFAIVAPILFLLVLALFQFASLLMSQNLLTAVAREGGRVASLPSTVSKDTVVTAIEDRLRASGIEPSSVTADVTPTTLDNAQPGDELCVSVSAPMSSMGWIWVIAPSDASLSAEITYTRE